ncbi:MAG: methyltransferase domain-containing protein [Bdellovibrionales bacterium]|nr:methyltransferase domain-containing protein [Bdellovibrionales bacterium]
MLILKSFLIRLKPKSAFYFTLPLGILSGLLSHSFLVFFQDACIFSVLLYAASQLALRLERQRKTDVHCPLCGYSDCTLLYRARKKTIGQKGSFACSSFDHAQYPDIHFCPECKNGFLSTLANKNNTDSVAKEAQNAYEEVVDTTYIENLPYRYDTYKRFTDTFHHLFEGKNVLEVGSYYGAFAESARTVVSRYTGLELSKHACSFLKTRHPELEIINGPVEWLQGKTEFYGKFDVIAMFDVIEHVADPVKTLESLRKLLKPGGKILFSTINIESTFAILLGPLWPWFMDMHLFYFSDRGYHTMLHRSGYFMKAHRHFPYRVSLRYFLAKVGSILGVEKLGHLFPNSKITLPIMLGDTVLIIGENAS